MRIVAFVLDIQKKKKHCNNDTHRNMLFESMRHFKLYCFFLSVFNCMSVCILTDIFCNLISLKY